jgi:hypothetical protein
MDLLGLWDLFQAIPTLPYVGGLPTLFGCKTSAAVLLIIQKIEIIHNKDLTCTNLREVKSLSLSLSLDYHMKISIDRRHNLAFSKTRL